MAGEELEQQNKITLHPNESPGELVVKPDKQSDIQKYKEVISERFAEAKTVEEYDKLIAIRQKIQELEVGDKRLNYAQQTAEIKLQDEKQKARLQRGQQIVASLISVSIGVYFLQAFPLAGLLFLILGLAKPLGYSLVEISELIDKLKGFPNKSDNLISIEEEKEIQSEETKNERF
jgi:hypothetical protein